MAIHQSLAAPNLSQAVCMCPALSLACSQPVSVSSNILGMLQVGHSCHRYRLFHRALHYHLFVLLYVQHIVWYIHVCLANEMTRLVESGIGRERERAHLMAELRY